jgi:hypothetical protein
MSENFKVITGAGSAFLKEVNDFITENTILQMSFTSNATNCVAFIYEPKIKVSKEAENDNGTKTRKPRVSSKHNTRNKESGK